MMAYVLSVETVLVILKVNGVLAWSWWWIWCPTWAPVALGLGAMLAVFLLTLVGSSEVKAQISGMIDEWRNR